MTIDNVSWETAFANDYTYKESSTVALSDCVGGNKEIS